MLVSKRNQTPSLEKKEKISKALWKDGLKGCICIIKRRPNTYVYTWRTLVYGEKPVSHTKAFTFGYNQTQEEALAKAKAFQVEITLASK